jgi:hypothetical protein
MKKLILTVIISALTFGVCAQNKTFTLPENEGERLGGQYIVIDEKGTPQENYNKVINYINKTYNTPSEVIKSQINGEYIRIEGISNLFKNGGVMIPTKHSLEFKFKQDKIKMTLNSLSSNSTPITPYCTYDKTHNSKGKVKNMMMNYAIKVTDGVNKLAESIKIGIAEESSKNTEDDW